jgi:hypothetical protein
MTFWIESKPICGLSRFYQNKLARPKGTEKQASVPFILPFGFVQGYEGEI